MACPQKAYREKEERKGRPPLFGSTEVDSLFALRAPTGQQQGHWPPSRGEKSGCPTILWHQNSHFRPHTAHWDHVPIEGPLDIVGDSAGGNLALSWALRRQNGDRLALLSPWVDLRVNGASSSNNVADHSAFDRDDLREYASLYLGGEAPTNPACSPVLADRASFAALGEVYIECAANELLNADAQLLASRMREAGVSLTTHEEARAHHGWQLLPDILPEAKQSAERLGQFLASP